MRRPYHRPIILGFVAALLLVACGGTPSATPARVQPAAMAATPVWRATMPPVQANNNAVILWNDAILQAVRDIRPGPPMVARALAILHTAMFDAWAAYDPVAVGTRLGVGARRPAAERTDENKRRAVSYAAYDTLVDLFPTIKPDFNAVMNGLGYNPNESATDPTSATAIGRQAAAAVLAAAHSDGSNQYGENGRGAYSDTIGYRPVNGPDTISDPNHWQPLRVRGLDGRVIVQLYSGPHWGLVTPFALTRGDQFRPPPPAMYPDQRYRDQADAVLAISARLTDTEKTIAEYWADGPATETPPGHWNLFAQHVSRRDRHTLDRDVQMFFALNNALCDASIAAWDAKLYYDYVRPITAIRFLYQGQTITAWAGPGRGIQPIPGEQWQPYQVATFVTPPFPDYVSGHSTFSAAAAEVLASFTGGDAFGLAVTIRAGSSRVEPGLVPAQPMTLTWPTFSAAADEAGLSRRYGGIHFEDADLAGRTLGRQVGALAWAKAKTFIDGTAVAP
jgi:hypothetical protein